MEEKYFRNASPFFCRLGAFRQLASTAYFGEAYNAMPSMKKVKGEHSAIGNTFNKLLKEIGNPIEFSLPELFNNWQPSYTSIKRNIYLTKKIKRRLEDDGIFCSCSSSNGVSGACGRDCHCGMLLSTCSSGCKCGSSCLNKPFHCRLPKKMKLVKTEKCGSGIVADEDIKQGEFVIEYVGEGHNLLCFVVIDDKTCEERLWKMKHRGETNFYLCEINRDMVIDATYKGNKSRYINHSCCPNTEMQKWIIEGETRIGIFATRDIKKGEHLTYDYQFVQFGADQDCHCGALGCRQKLGVKPSKPKVLSSDAALKIVACQVAALSPKVKAILSRKDVSEDGVLDIGTSKYDPIQRRYARNCIGEVIRLVRPTDKSYVCFTLPGPLESSNVLRRIPDCTWSCLKMEVSNFLTCQKKIGSCVLPDVVVWICCGIKVCCCCCGVPVTVMWWYTTKVCQRFLAKPMVDCLLCT
ncbi:hypothetical protein RHGRI_025302 [Rhododendron griersonianum]|uniref:Histone-lysine N-methyltransferase ASHH3 n=2 Tax=Rhododendron griersonianum TaxID=479676 RepID=A0AAV6IUN7_9ERIC|nr:hypothetical protein RHGRI_025302 [Rhododendron griersonianum]